MDSGMYAATTNTKFLKFQQFRIYIEKKRTARYCYPPKTDLEQDTYGRITKAHIRFLGDFVA
jgi:hypothetical protein